MPRFRAFRAFCLTRPLWRFPSSSSSSADLHSVLKTRLSVYEGACEAEKDMQRQNCRGCTHVLLCQRSRIAGTAASIRKQLPARAARRNIRRNDFVRAEASRCYKCSMLVFAH